ncbi:unnamed protein product [Ranitomeya imitator]|uniref:VHS domain-containing protein n=1 Tax=Ranitomeya imitator TaxID=111125 RepID=A0ABN9LXM4_9NEOB|nr:unnamed protein product [Ranitomeya imitator]
MTSRLRDWSRDHDVIEGPSLTPSLGTEAAACTAESWGPSEDKATNPCNRQEDWEYIISFCDQINKELEGFWKPA